MMQRPDYLCAALLLLSVIGTSALADDDAAPIQIILKDHRFTPSEIHVPAGKPVFLEILNQDQTADEFEMKQLAIEKTIVGGGHGKVRIRPLGPGRYHFVGEFNEATAQGDIVAE